MYTHSSVWMHRKAWWRGEGGKRTYRVAPLLKEVEEGLAHERRGPFDLAHVCRRIKPPPVQNRRCSYSGRARFGSRCRRVQAPGVDSAELVLGEAVGFIESSTRVSQRYKRARRRSGAQHHHRCPHLPVFFPPLAAAAAVAVAAPEPEPEPAPRPQRPRLTSSVTRRGASESARPQSSLGDRRRGGNKCPSELRGCARCRRLQVWFMGR